MGNLIKKINTEIAKAFKDIHLDESYAYISISGLPELADYQINSCFNIAKAQKKNPMDVASEISDVIKDLTIDGTKAFLKVEPSKPGFVNLKINDELLYVYIKKILNDDKLGVGDKETILNDNIKIILLDYGGANVAKPLHVGHLRVAVIGEALKRLYNRLGIKTIGDIHLGDYGLQMGLVI